MIKEFTPYQEALELKELGFDEPCFGFWDGYNGDSHLFFKPRVKYHWIVRLFSKTPNMISYTQGMLEYIEGEGSVLAPLFQQAFRWFRKPENGSLNHLDFMYEYLKDDSMSYEEAELECLKKLIEIVKNKGGDK